VQARANGRGAHGFAELWLDERVTTTAGRSRMRFTASWRSSWDSTRGMADLDEVLLRELRLERLTRRAAVSPVASETTWSSTGGFGIGGQPNPGRCRL